MIDITVLISSKYDSEYKSGNGTHFGYFKGYKFHYIATATDIIISLVLGNVYDNEVYSLLYEAKIYSPFLILSDAAYDSVECFEIASDLEFNLLNDINIRKAISNT